MDVAAATRAIAARAERLDPQLTTTAFVVEERGGKVFLDATRAGGATVVAAYSPRARAGVPVSFPLPWDDLADASPADFTSGQCPGLIGDADPWTDLMPAPQELDPGLVEEGHTIPVARVAAMHEGKRRAKARRDAEQQGRLERLQRRASDALPTRGRPASIPCVSGSHGENAAIEPGSRSTGTGCGTSDAGR